MHAFCVYFTLFTVNNVLLYTVRFELSFICSRGQTQTVRWSGSGWVDGLQDGFISIKMDSGVFSGKKIFRE